MTKIIFEKPENNMYNKLVNIVFINGLNLSRKYRLEKNKLEFRIGGWMDVTLYDKKDLPKIHEHILKILSVYVKNITKVVVVEKENFGIIDLIDTYGLKVSGIPTLRWKFLAFKYEILEKIKYLIKG